MDGRNIGIVLFIVLGCIGVSEANIGRCSQELFQCNAHKNDLMKEGKLFESERHLQAICSKNYFFSLCVDSKLQTCASGSKIPVLAEFFYESRLIAREVCLKDSKFNKLYLDASSCINSYALKSLKVCERSSLKVTEERHQSFDEQFCRDISRVFDCQENYLNEVCGGNAGNLYKRLQVYQKNWDFECYRFLSKHKTIEKDPSTENDLLSIIGKVITGSKPTIGNFENSKRKLFKNYSDVNQTIPFVVFAEQIAVKELLDNIKRDTMTKEVANVSIVRNLTHLLPDVDGYFNNLQIVAFNRISYSEVRKGTGQYKVSYPPRFLYMRNFWLHLLKNNKTYSVGCAVGHFDWVIPESSLENIKCSWKTSDGKEFKCMVRLDTKCPKDIDNKLIEDGVIPKVLTLLKWENNPDIINEIATVKIIKFSLNLIDLGLMKRIGMYADPIEDVDNTAVITDSGKVDNEHGSELFSFFSEEKNKYSPFELYVNAIADLASREVNFGKDNTLGYVYDPELRGIFCDSRRDYLEGVHDETMNIMLQSRKGYDLFEKRSLEEDVKDSISNVENIEEEEGVDEANFHPLYYESMEAYNAPTHDDTNNESMKKHQSLNAPVVDINRILLFKLDLAKKQIADTISSIKAQFNESPVLQMLKKENKVVKLLDNFHLINKLVLKKLVDLVIILQYVQKERDEHGEIVKKQNYKRVFNGLL